MVGDFARTAEHLPELGDAHADHVVAQRCAVPDLLDQFFLRNNPTRVAQEKRQEFQHLGFGFNAASPVAEFMYRVVKCEVVEREDHVSIVT